MIQGKAQGGSREAVPPSPQNHHLEKKRRKEQRWEKRKLKRSQEKHTFRDQNKSKPITLAFPPSKSTRKKKRGGKERVNGGRGGKGEDILKD